MFNLRTISIVILIIFNNILFAQNNTKNISTSIIPLQSLISMVTDNTNNEIEVVFSDSKKSPHDSTVNYKKIKIIKNSDIIFLISKNFEQEIIQHIDNSKTKIVYLENHLKSYLDDVNELSYKKSHSDHNQDGKQEHNHNHNHYHEFKDYHIWLDTNISQEILKIIAKELSEINPEHEKKYNENVKKYSTQIKNLQKEMNQNLLSINSNFMVYHNAWNYFIKENNLSKNYKGSVIANEEDHHHVDTNLSAKNVIELTNYIKKEKISCILLEPQFEDTTVQNVIKSNNLKTATLDPIGDISKNSINNYFLMMKKNTQQLKSCL